jgi:hypothetical protein
MIEEWGAIPGFSGKYEVSTLFVDMKPLISVCTTA